MKLLVSGASGFIGSCVVSYLQSYGHKILRLVRSNPSDGDVLWQPSKSQMDRLPEGLDGVIHLAGESIAGRWTRDKKRRIYDSRVQGTRFLSERLAAMEHRPNVFICASAVGYYGHQRDAVLTETTPPGVGFLSSVCREWEAAGQPAQQAGIRTVHLRLGMVLAAHGGALARMLPAFKMGLGGKLGNGRQWISWISLMDVIRIIDFALHTESLDGPINAVSPEPVQNHAFTHTLGHTLHRPTILPIPAPLLRLVFGEFAKETLLASTRAIPEKLLNCGFSFEHPNLPAALTAALT